MGIKWKIPDPVNVPTAEKKSIEDHRNVMKWIQIPRPINVLRIHLNAGRFRNGKIIAPQSAEQLINVTVIKPIRISSMIRREKKQKTQDELFGVLLFHVTRPVGFVQPSLNFTLINAGDNRRISSRVKFSFVLLFRISNTLSRSSND